MSCSARSVDIDGRYFYADEAVAEALAAALDARR